MIHLKLSVWMSSSDCMLSLVISEKAWSLLYIFLFISLSLSVSFPLFFLLCKYVTASYVISIPFHAMEEFIRTGYCYMALGVWFGVGFLLGCNVLCSLKQMVLWAEFLYYSHTL